MGIVTQSKYVTSDGKSFDDLDVAQSHELGLELADAVGEIAAKHEISERMTASLKRYVPLFIHELNYVPRPETEEVPQPDLDFLDQDAAAA